MSWSPSEYEFQPYELQAQRLPSGAGPTNSESGKRKGGRQRRSSILCQVDGCGMELINEKTYYKRYRICITHCNMKSMVLQGRRQRFCQQCGRFHDVTEFEGTRKSCRRKLERHNQRRRTVPAKGCAWQSDSEEDEMDLTEDAEYQVLANMKRSGRARSARLKSLETTTASPPNSRSLAEESPCCSIDKLYSSMDLDQPSNNIAGFVPLVDTHAAGSSAALKDLQQPLSSSDGGAVTRDGLPLGDGARSNGNSPNARLRTGNNVSSLPIHSFAAGTATPGLPAPPMDPTPFGTMKDVPFFNDILDDDILGGLLMFPDEISDSLVVSQHDELSGGADGSVAVEHRQASGLNILAGFRDAGAAATATAGAGDAVGDWFNGNFASELNTATSPRMANMGNAVLGHQQQQQQPHFGLPQYHRHGGVPATALEAASSIVTLDAPALVGYNVDDYMLRLSIKLFNCTPDMLAPQVKSELTSLLRVAEQNLVEGYIRPGCMHVTLSVRAPTQGVFSNDSSSADAENATSQATLVAAVERLLESSALDDEAKKSMLVQLHDELIVVKQSKVIAAIDMGKSMGLLPQILAIRPLAVVAAGHGTGRTQVMLAGRRLNGPSSLIMCRQSGRNLTVELPDDEGDENIANQVIQIGVLGLAAGCAELEVQVGSFLGPCKPLVALPDAATVEEIRQLERLEAVQNGLANNLPVDGFLRDLGLVAQYLDRENAEAEGRAVPTYTPNLLNSIQKIACKLVAAAVARKWVALTSYLLPATTAAGQTKAEAVAAMDGACPHECTLLHVAVGTGHVEIVQKLAEWAAEPSPSSSTSSSSAAAASVAGPFAVNAKGLAGVTPLHIAAILPPKLCYAMRSELTNMSSATPKLWGLAQSDDGTTPEGLAEMVAGGGRSSSSGMKSSRTHIMPTHMGKPTPFSMSVNQNDAVSPLENVIEKSNSHNALSESASFTRMLSWKSRADVKANFVDPYIENMVDEVRSLRDVKRSSTLSVWHVGIAFGSALTLALGTAAMALRLAYA